MYILLYDAFCGPATIDAAVAAPDAALAAKAAPAAAAPACCCCSAAACPGCCRFCHEVSIAIDIGKRWFCIYILVEDERDKGDVGGNHLKD